MPTFQNDNDFAVRVTNFSGEAQVVPPGHSVKSYQDLTVDGFTETSVSPVDSPTFNWNVVMIGVAGGSGTVTVGKRITGLEIFNRVDSSGEVDIHFNNATGPRAALLLPGRGIEFAKEDVWGKVNTVIVESTFGAVVDIREMQ
ncbi:MAG: hypothetical protein ABFC98_05835 [Candidatus Cloacimonas sp.]